MYLYFICSTLFHTEQNINQPEIYKIKNGLHELVVKGKSGVIKGQVFCEDSVVIMRE